MPRAGLEALATVLKGAPGAQKTLSESMFKNDQNKRETGRYQMELEKFKMQKQALQSDKKFYDNLYAWVKNSPQYGSYSHLLPSDPKSAYGLTQQGKEKAMQDLAKLKHMVDKVNEAKGLDSSFSIVPDLALDIDDFDKKIESSFKGQAQAQGSKLAADVFTGSKTGAPPTGEGEYLQTLAAQQGGDVAIQQGAQKPYIGVLQEQESAAAKARSMDPNRPLSFLQEESLRLRKEANARASETHEASEIKRTTESVEKELKVKKDIQDLKDDNKAKKDKIKKEQTEKYKALEKRQMESDIHLTDKQYNEAKQKIESEAEEAYAKQKSEYDIMVNALNATQATLQAQKEASKRMQRKDEKTKAETEKVKNPLGLNLPMGL